MKNMLDGLTGVIGVILTTLTGGGEIVSYWVSIICTACIALVTCGLQIYRAIRDRDKDLQNDKKEESQDDTKENKN